jgi:hypothetical protein
MATFAGRDRIPLLVRTEPERSSGNSPHRQARSKSSPTRGRSSAEVSASLQLPDRVRSELLDIHLADEAGAVGYTSRRWRNIQAKPGDPGAGGASPGP